MQILIVEDDLQTAHYLIKGLTEQGHNVSHESEGNNGLFMALENHYDIIIMDRMLPKLDGLSIIKTIRAAGNQTPIIILSALGEVNDRVRGLKAGGDDYLVKPFAFAELLARLEVLLRRSDKKSVETLLKIADLELDQISHTVKRAGKLIALQPREFRLLEYLMRHEGQVVTRTMLLESVWDFHFDPQTNVIDVHISKLRSKIDKDFDPALLHTIRGAGYSLRLTKS